MRARTALVLVASLACACTDPAPSASPKPDAAPSSPPPVASAQASEVVDAAPPVDAADAAPPTPFGDRRYKTVLHTGDSMVGGGLCRALKPLFATEGTKFVRDVWESGSIEAFSYSDRIPKLLEKHRPDLILLSLGANDVYGPVTPDLTKAIEKVAAQTQMHTENGAPRDCIWIGPPIWKPRYKVTVDAIAAHAAPCVFFDGTGIEMERKPDKIHPNERGGEQWATAFWRFFRGTDVPPAPDGGAIFPIR